MSPPDDPGAWVPALPRRQLLRAAALGLAVPALLAGVGGCGFGSEPDPLLALAATARADTALVEAAARTYSQLTARVTPVATARRAHAAALEQEITRLDAGHTPPSNTAGSPAAPRADAGPEAALNGVLQALAAAARQAADLVPGLPGHRAGLVGSIAACCAGYRAVLA